MNASDDVRLWYQHPATEWKEALPIGNGRLGTMVFGGMPTERLQLNEDTLWSGGPREWKFPAARALLPELRSLVFAERYADADRLSKRMHGPWNESYQPMGHLVLSFPATSTPTAYFRDLNLDTGIAMVRYQVDGDRYPIK